MKVSNIAPFGVRMPPDLKKRLEVSAKKNSRSLNAEVVHWLQKAMDEQAEEDESGVARHMPLTMIDGFDGWVNNQPSEAATVAVLEQMRLLLGELENQITKK
ncbi:Arc family DNA-binding protein [Aeromonas caviae]|uniref:Arc family DNA-binding protein n=1 Tax=Aeromonas caviae TaxID=648 RepID=UPI0029DAC0BA|nr:Arc family DNA-binding protein [Aeromonas caviae]MDX7769986.1 Arc family DNA-binding protein [Aeromonas caviae]MDX7848348.1 Arc family DNA-binding protein [Aeromonas caviae]